MDKVHKHIVEQMLHFCSYKHVVPVMHQSNF